MLTTGIFGNSKGLFRRQRHLLSRIQALQFGNGLCFVWPLVHVASETRVKSRPSRAKQAPIYRAIALNLKMPCRGLRTILDNEIITGTASGFVCLHTLCLSITALL